MILHREEATWVADSSFEEKDVVKAARFRWDPAKRRWWTDQLDRAALLAAYADDDCRSELTARREAMEAAKAASRATDAAIDLPCPDGLAYLPFQRAGIAYLLERPAALLADEMGLGKTVEILGVINADSAARRNLVVCPAHLRLNWQREAERWLVRPTRILVATAASWPADVEPDDRDVLVIGHYETCVKHAATMQAIDWHVVAIDETHYIKNPKAKRSMAVYGIPARRRILATGTPIVNRPKELWPLLNQLDPTGWPKFFSFAMRYCAATQNRWGWDFSGASNLDELQDRLRETIMVRRLKRDVLTELPAKTRQIIELPVNGCAKAVAKERAALAKLLKSDDPYAAAVNALDDGPGALFTEMAAIRHATAIAKVPAVIEHVIDALDSHAKVVLFCHHHDVADALVAGLAAFKAIRATGQDSVEERQAAVNVFQSDVNVRVIVCSLYGAGTGFTLTAANLVVFAELDWVPGTITQAEDRLHRIGQTGNVLVHHLVIDGTLDCRLARVLVSKQKIADAALDNPHDDRVALAEEAARAAIVAAEKRDGARLTTEQREATLGPLPDCPEGRYALPSATGANDLDFYRVDRPTEGQWAGRVFVTRVLGGHSTLDPALRVPRWAVRSVLERIVAAGPREAAMRYGQELGHCGRCGRSLTDDQSRTIGLGATCAAAWR